MISLDIHGVDKITAKANAAGPDNNWVTIEFENTNLHITVFFDSRTADAAAYAAAISGVRIAPPPAFERAA